MKDIQDHLHIRLLNKTIQSKEAEEKFIQLIQLESGYVAVQRMTGMFKDMELSKDLLPSFL